ncbi:MAG: HPP family protein [Sphingobium sp.]
MPFKVFRPLLAGGNFNDRLFACVGALMGIGLTGLVCTWLGAGDQALPLLVAPIGASAVLLFAVPASPLAQPWSVVGGNIVSALVGITVAWLIPDRVIAAGLAVSLAILAMSLLRCLHPPGGAAALTAVIGGPAVAAAGYGFAFMPVGLNSALLVGLGWLFHRFSGHSYPHRPVPVASAPAPVSVAPGLSIEDIDLALKELGETFDVSREDLDALFRKAEANAAARLARDGPGDYVI